MSTTVKMWAVYDGKKLLALKKGNREDVLPLVGIYHNPNKWALMRDYGLECRPVRVTIEEIENESQRDH